VGYGFSLKIAVSFGEKIDDLGTKNVQYQVWYNSTNIATGIDIFGRQLQSLMRGLDEAIMTVLNDPSATISANMNISMKDWPTVPPSSLSDSVVQQLGPVFFFCCVMVIFINALGQILAEKEQKLRHGMEVMGLKASIYWISEFLSNTVLVSIGSLMTVCLGLAFGFGSFRKTDFLILFLTFFLFGQAMVVFAFFLSTFFRNAQSGVFVGIFVFIIGLMFESFVFSSGYIGYIWYKPDTPVALSYFLCLFPFFNFGKLFLDIQTLTTGQLDVITNTYIPGDGFPWKLMYVPIPATLLPTYGDSLQPVVPAPINSIYWFCFDILIYSVLTWYFDNVIANEFGVRKPLYFFLTPAYWGFADYSSHKSNEEWLASLKATPPPFSGNIDADVVKEREDALSDQIWPAVKVIHLRKQFKDWRGRVTKTAVFDTCINFEKDKLVALLGQNGAGKSTTMNILSGLAPSSYGDCLIYGHSLKNQMNEIREIMGVCPQHDILFHELTAREHIELYAGLKGVPRNEWEGIISERLGAVKLLKVLDNPVGSYSGGMKRRLSVVISTIGDPKIVYMDGNK
jgi:ABC-type lipoprotein export system ATPase subunit